MQSCRQISRPYPDGAIGAGVCLKGAGLDADNRPTDANGTPGVALHRICGNHKCRSAPADVCRMPIGTSRNIGRENNNDLLPRQPKSCPRTLATI
jgi:hypothetical protein